MSTREIPVAIQKVDLRNFDQYSKINNLSVICRQTDPYAYYFPAEDKELICYGASMLPQKPDEGFVGALLILPDEDSTCLYGIVHPDFRRQHIMHRLLLQLETDKSIPSSCFEIHLPDDAKNPISDLSSDIPSLHTFLCKENFLFSHHEYLMYCTFPGNSHSPLPSGPELIYDPEQSEFSLWDDETYLGGCRIMADEDNRVVTFYDFEILPDYRSKGYGRIGFQLILHELETMGFQKLILHVSGQNKIAHSLYRSCGLNVQSSFSVYRHSRS